MTESEPYLEDAPRLASGGGRHFPVLSSGISLGRSRACDVYVPDRRASRRHAEIHRDDEFCVLRDLDSANGTWLNGRRITAPQGLRDGDEIAIAGAAFVFRDPEATLRDRDFPLLVVDDTSGDIWVNRQPISLSPKERALFDLLHRSAGRTCSKQEVARAAWPEYRAEVYDYQIESLVKRLREKLEPDPRNPVLILTERGHGYRLVCDH